MSTFPVLPPKQIRVDFTKTSNQQFALVVPGPELWSPVVIGLVYDTSAHASDCQYVLVLANAAGGGLYACPTTPQIPPGVGGVISWGQGLIHAGPLGLDFGVGGTDFDFTAPIPRGVQLREGEGMFVNVGGLLAAPSSMFSCFAIVEPFPP